MYDRLLKEKIVRSLSLPMYYWNRLEAKAADEGTNRSGALLSILEKEFGEVPQEASQEEFYSLLHEPRSLEQKHLLDYRPQSKLVTLAHMLWVALDAEAADRGKSRAYILGRMIRQVIMDKSVQIKF